jgi:dihydroorotate dehydrogenase (NAD+) catalytic subunit
VTAWRLARSYAWNAAHAPALPPRPRKLPPPAPVKLFDRRLESAVGIAAGALPSAKWVGAYARLGYGWLTYGTVRSQAVSPLAVPNLLHCRLGENAVVQPAPRRLDSADVTWAVSLGMPSLEPDEWQADLARARKRLGPDRLLAVSVGGTPLPEGDAEQLAEDFARCALWAVEAGADAIELCLAAPAGAPTPAGAVFEHPKLAGLVAERVRRRIGGRPLLAKLGASASPRALHEVATRLARWVDGFVLIHGLARKLTKPDGSPALAGPGRDAAMVVGAAIYPHARLQLEELVAWRKAGAWSHAILGGGGLTTTTRISEALAAGADLALVATAALVDPLIALRPRP